MKETDIMQLITKDYSWEQVLYKIIAWEGLDPWDLDITKLSGAFLEQVEKMTELDFKIPAKYVIIAAVLLRMKSDHLHFIDWLTSPEEDAVEEAGGEIEQSGQRDLSTLEVNPITMPPVRYAKRKITANELVFALRKVLTMQEKRQVRHEKARKEIKIDDNNISERISNLYERINGLLAKIKQDEIAFSKIIEKQGREHMIDTFIPLIYLDHERRVKCRQDDFFHEIFVSHPPPEPKSEAERAKSEGAKARRLVPAV
jgi:segregation and condensation protein A